MEIGATHAARFDANQRLGAPRSGLARSSRINGAPIARNAIAHHCRGRG
jgi:hypothetical protein